MWNSSTLSGLGISFVKTGMDWKGKQVAPGGGIVVVPLLAKAKSAEEDAQSFMRNHVQG
jgi:hypothetical protein